MIAVTMENCHSFLLHATGYHFTATHGCHANTDTTPIQNKFIKFLPIVSWDL